jgi:hypothetical protein
LTRTRLHLLFHLDPETGALVLEYDSDGVDDPDVLMRLTVHNDFVFDFSAFAHIQVMLSGKAVVPTAVPGREHVSILLPCVSELRTSQCLNIDKPVGISIGTEIDLSLGRRSNFGICVQPKLPEGPASMQTLAEFYWRFVP